MKISGCLLVLAVAFGSFDGCESQRWKATRATSFNARTQVQPRAQDIPDCGEQCAKVLGLTNQLRESMGLSKLCLNSRLMATAKMHNDYQVMTDKMTHIGPGGQTLGDRLLLNGYEYKAGRENVAQGMSGAKNAMNGWVNSDGHKKNLLSDTVHVGIVYSPKGKFWTQVFGSPMEAGDQTCDMTTKYGKYGTTASNTISNKKAGGCGTKCRHLRKVINSRRAQARLPPLCISQKLSLAAEEYLALQSSRSTDLLEEKITQTGYSWKKYATLAIQVSFTTTKRSGIVEVTDELLLPALSKQINGGSGDSSVLGKEYTQMGIAGSGDLKNWMIVFGDTWDVTNDVCADGTSPRDTGVSEKHGKVNESLDHNPNSALARAFGFSGRAQPTKVYDSTAKATSLAFTYSNEVAGGGLAGLVRPETTPNAEIPASSKNTFQNYPAVSTSNYPDVSATVPSSTTVPSRFTTQVQPRQSQDNECLRSSPGWMQYTCEYAKDYCNSATWGADAKRCCPGTCPSQPIQELPTSAINQCLQSSPGWRQYTCDYARDYCNSASWGADARRCCPTTCGSTATPTDVTSEDYSQYYKTWWRKQIEQQQEQQLSQQNYYYNSRFSDDNNPWQNYPTASSASLSSFRQQG